MSKYSILFEAEEHHVIGPFRFAVYKDFTPGETKAFNKLNKQHASSTYQSMQLAQRIAKEHKIKPSEALKILGNISDDSNQDYLFEYAEEVQALSDSVLNDTEQRAAYVTLFMQMRGEARMPGDAVWIRTTDWSESDTDSMPGQLITEISEFINWERYGWPAEGKAPEGSTAPTLPPATTSSPS